MNKMRGLDQNPLELYINLKLGRQFLFLRYSSCPFGKSGTGNQVYMQDSTCIIRFSYFRNYYMRSKYVHALSKLTSSDII